MRRVYPANTNPRCPTCGTRPDLCICADLPTYRVPTRFVFVQHAQEACKPTNSARLVCRILESASIVPWERTAPPPLPEDAILLYPLADAEPLSPADLEAGATIVVPDGTWNQTSKIANVLGRFPYRRCSLDCTPETAWRVRQAGVSGRISSAQAVAMVLRLCGEDDAAAALLAAHEEAARRILSMRGIAPAAPCCHDPNTPPESPSCETGPADL